MKNSNSYDNFKKEFPIPTNPVERCVLTDVEKQINFSFPNDYKTFIKDYGTTCFGDFIWILNPLSQNKNLNLLELQKSIHKTIVFLEENDDSDFKNINIGFEHGNMLPMAITDNGDYVFWRIDSTNSNYKITISNFRSGEFEHTNYTFLDFFIALENKHLKSNIFPEDFLIGGKKKFKTPSEMDSYYDKQL